MESLGLESSGSDQGPARHREYTCALGKLRLLGVQASCTSNKALKSGAPIIMGSEGAVFL